MAPPSRARARRGKPAPSEAGTTLLVHDLKNLATRLSLLLQNLDRHYEDPLFKDTALDVLDHTVAHLGQLAAELRDRDGRLLVKLKVDLVRVLREGIRDAWTGRPAGIELVDDCRPVPATWGDAFLLRCAFGCAIENALEAMAGRGRLVVSTRLARRGGAARVQVEIADDGPGMSEEIQRRVLYEPFASTKENGLGLGVYTIRQVAALHGATVRVTSREGQGTRVRFRFPVGD